MGILNDKPGRGGKRPGSGRKRAGYKLTTVSFKIRSDLADRFKELAIKLREQLTKPE